MLLWATRAAPNESIFSRPQTGQQLHKQMPSNLKVHVFLTRSARYLPLNSCRKAWRLCMLWSFLRLPHLRKHRYLPHGSHFGARNGRSGLPGCCWSALKGCSGPALALPVRSKWLLWPALVPPVRSKRLLKPASTLPVRSKLPFWPALVPPVRSKSLSEPASVH